MILNEKTEVIITDVAHIKAKETRKRNLEGRIEARNKKEVERLELVSILKELAADTTGTIAERLEAVELIFKLERI